MRKLLLFFAMLCVSLGTWATITTSSTTWCQWNSYADQENVLTIYVDDPGELATAIAGLDFTDVKILHISARNREASLLELSSEDIAALSSVNVETIEMMRAYVSPFTFTNSNLKRVILPYNWTRAEVKAFGQANSTSANFEACISTNDQDKYESREGDVTLIAYLNKANTLKDAIMRTWNDTHGYAPLGNQVYQGGGDCSRLRYLHVMGNFCAKDISSQGEYDSNGHYVTNGVADENSTVWNRNTDGGNVYTPTNNPNAVPGALQGCQQLFVIDLKDGYVPDKYAADIVVGYNGMQATNLREVWMPEDPRFKTVPADYLNINSEKLHQICIPSNITKIRTRAFGSGGCRINYVWTKDITGKDTFTKFDNGAYFVSEGTEIHKFMDNPDPTDLNNKNFEEGDYNNFSYGTITLPPNLELIERFAFAACEKVKDVYSLNKIAPECHVDAFSSVNYVANNSYEQSSIKDGIITRDAYRNGSADQYKFMTVLHYPRETETPNLQRYTDVTRDYSVATGERDGKGNTIYYPNQSEFVYSYLQGSYGYLWKAWDDARNWYDNELSLGYGDNFKLDEASHKAIIGSKGQNGANDLWLSNNNAGKTDRSFYDVTTGDNNASGEVNAPSGLAPYYNTMWPDNNGVNVQLYPQADMSEETFYKYVDANAEDFENGVTVYTKSGDDYTPYTGSTVPEGTYYKRVQEQELNADGSLKFESCGNGHFVKYYTYEEDPEGGFVEIATPTGFTEVTSPVEGNPTYYSDLNGTEATPTVGNGFWYQDGEKNVYAQVDKSKDAIGAQSQYYTKNGDTYTPSNLMFYYWNAYQPLYYGTDQTEEKSVYSKTSTPVSGVTTYYSDENGANTVAPTMNATYYYDPVTSEQTSYVGTNKPVSGVTAYYSSNDGSNPVSPTLATSYYGNSCQTFYYDSNNNEVYVTTYDPNITKYYVKWSWGNTQEYTDNLEFASTVYYKKTENVTTYSSSNIWQGEKLYYTYGWHNNEEGQSVQEYYVVTPSFSQEYYYVSGTETVPIYGSSDYYIEGKTWYTYNSGSKTYTQVTLDWNNYLGGQDYYYVSGQVPNYISAEGQYYNASTTYYTNNTGTEEAETVTFNTTYYIQAYSYSYEEYPGQTEGKRVKRIDSYREGTAEELAAATTRYCPVMQDVAFHDISNYNDYRGWHQFVLASYSYNGKTPMEPLRSWISDNDWWTICEPYDLRYKDLLNFFGTNDVVGTPKIPYLSKLMYVIRDVKNQKITLMFSKNLMEYKEQFLDANGTGTGRVHGVVDDQTKWIGDGGYANEAALIEANPVILHAGVPYLIKPNLKVDDAGNISGTRMFEIYKHDNSELYNRLKESAELSGSAQKTLIYNGEYTVPAYVVGYDPNNEASSEESLDDDGELVITMKDGTTITYQDSKKDPSNTIKYGNENVSYRISSANKYTFVGSFYKSVMPQYCYFLGWDSKKNCATFWYSQVQDKSGWNWNNETAIICPNFDTTTLIHEATGLDDPARWTITNESGKSALEPDDFVVGGNAKVYTMDFGADNYFDGISDATSLNAVKATEGETVVYSADGIYMGNSLKGLAKGLYIVNGKKYVVK